MDVIRLFNWWQGVVEPPGTGFRARFQSALFGTKLFCFLMEPQIASYMLGVLTHGVSFGAVVAARLPLYTAVCHQSTRLFAYQRHDLVLLLKDMSRVTAAVCAGGVPGQAEAHSRVVRKYTVRTCYAFSLWCVVSVISTVIPVVVDGTLAMEMWPWFGGDLGLWLGGAIQSVMSYPDSYPCYVLCAIMLSAMESVAVLFDIVGAQMAAASSWAQAYQAARRHALVCSLSARVEALFDFQLTCLMVGLLTVPALSTLLVVHGPRDLFGYLSIPFLAVFYAMCWFSHRIEDSSAHIALAAYESLTASQLTCGPDAPGQHQRLATQRLLLMVMIRARKPQAMTAFRASLRYDLRTCHRAFKTWYKTLHFLLNVHTDHGR